MSVYHHTSSSAVVQASPPPSSNTGVERTGQGLLVDWLSFTAPDGTSPHDLAPFLPSDAELVEGRGAMGYRRSRRFGNIVFLDQGQPGMGVHMVLSGQGCREVEALGMRDWSGYLRYILDAGWKIARLDLALDDFTGTVTVDKVEGLVRTGSYTSRWRDWHITESRRGGVVCKTVYLGSGHSEMKLRVYDKRSEQASRRAALEAGLPAIWTRVEVEARDARARAIAEILADSDHARGVRHFLGVLRSYVDFKVEDASDSNKRRWVTVDWWDAFLQGVAKCRLAVAPVVRTVETVRAWVERQVAPSLALLLAAFGGDVGYLVDVAKQGRQRWTWRHRAMLAVA